MKHKAFKVSTFVNTKLNKNCFSHGKNVWQYNEKVYYIGCFIESSTKSLIDMKTMLKLFSATLYILYFMNNCNKHFHLQ